MKKKTSQRLFWKKWPFKIILGQHSDNERVDRWKNRFIRPSKNDTYAWQSQFRRWFKKTFPDSGIRQENKISVFLKTQEDVNLVVDTWNSYILEVWSPESESALALMKDHVHDVIRPNPWYKKFTIRARILYSHDFKVNGLDSLRNAVQQFDSENWRAGGLLKTLLSVENKGKTPYPGGQSFYLYLLDNEDAVMLKLQASNWIDRFERQRKP